MSFLQLYSYNLIKENRSILESRKIVKIDELVKNINNFDELIDNPCVVLSFTKDFSFLGFHHTTYHYNNRTYSEYEKDYSKKWKIIDAQTKKHKKENIENIENIENNNENILNIQSIQKNKGSTDDNKYVYYPSKKPVYSLFIYGSDYCKDFNGGKFEFSDGTKIKPQKNMCILFDSREAHYIHKLKGGTCNYIIVNFYKNK